MIQPKIQEVYVTTTIVHKLGHDYLRYAKKIVFPETLITFTPEEFEQFKREFGKELLEKASQGAKIIIKDDYSEDYKIVEEETVRYNSSGVSNVYPDDCTKHTIKIDKESITGVLDKFLENNKI